MVRLDQNPPLRYAAPPAVGVRRRWSVFGSVKGKKVKSTVEAVERTPNEEEKEKGGQRVAYYNDAVAVRSWSAQVDDRSDGEDDGDGHGGTLGGETVARGGEMARSQPDPRAAMARKEEAEGAVWFGSA